jgi:AcrR family transcriptional regulator
MPRSPDKEKRILDAARALVRAEGWAALSMSALAKRARLPLAELYTDVPSRSALIALFLRETDLAVLKAPRAFSSADRPRDRVFDVIMARFEALTPDRDIMRSLARDLSRSPLDALAAAPALVSSMQWMLEAADVEASAAASTALALVYASVLPVWAEDDDPGLAKTMAALDRRLRRIEQLLHDRAQAEEAKKPEPSPAPKKRPRKRKK